MGDEAARCGHPTRRGGLCRAHALAGGDGRCYAHSGLPRTPAEIAASRTNARKHAYFVSGFLDEGERALFESVLEGTVDPGEIKRHIIAALVVRAARMTKWEGEGKPVSGFTTEVFGELRKAVESVTPDELRVKHSWDDAEVAAQVERVLAGDLELLVRLLPEPAREAALAAMRARPAERPQS